MELLTVPDVARRLKMGRSTVYLMAERGELPGMVKIGRSVRVLPDVLDAWLRDRATNGENGHEPGRGESK